MDNKPLVTVTTCVYNGNKTMHRVFDSLRKQTYLNIEHVIVDDGSTDWQLLNPALERYRREAPFIVKVFRKENGGKHTATNVAWTQATGKFVINLDSDDELLPDAIEFLVNQWFEIPEDKVSQYWCVHGRCQDQKERRFIGDRYPDGINELSFAEARKVTRKGRGDKVGLMLRQVLNNYRYPEPVGVKFVSEKVVWDQICCQYRIWYTNEVVKVYYKNEGFSLAHPILNRQHFSNNAYNKSWFLAHRKQYLLEKKTTMEYVLKHAVSYFLSIPLYQGDNSYWINRGDKGLTVLQVLSIIPGKIVARHMGKKVPL